MQSGTSPLLLHAVDIYLTLSGDVTMSFCAFFIYCSCVVMVVVVSFAAGVHHRYVSLIPKMEKSHETFALHNNTSLFVSNNDRGESTGLHDSHLGDDVEITVRLHGFTRVP